MIYLVYFHKVLSSPHFLSRASEETEFLSGQVPTLFAALEDILHSYSV